MSFQIIPSPDKFYLSFDSISVISFVIYRVPKTGIYYWRYIFLSRGSAII